jgi:hypothetical protein
VQLRCLDGGNWPLIHGEIHVIVLHHGSSTPADLERLSGRRRRLQLLRLGLWLWGLRHVSVAVVELKVPGKGDGHVGAVGLHIVVAY